MHSLSSTIRQALTDFDEAEVARRLGTLKKKERTGREGGSEGGREGGREGWVDEWVSGNGGVRMTGSASWTRW